MLRKTQLDTKSRFMEVRGFFKWEEMVVDG